MDACKERYFSMCAAALTLSLACSLPLPAGAATEGACEAGSAIYPTIQSAVNEPTCAIVAVPKGTFRENVVVRRDVTIRGADAKHTIVDGSLNEAAVFAVSPGLPGEVVAVTFEGLTIQKGGNKWGGHPNGGGIFAVNATVTVNSCIVTENVARDYGGGISIFSGVLTVNDSLIARNSARDGGGVRGQNLSNGITSVQVYISNSTIENNTATRWGGGVMVVGGGLIAPGGIVAKLALAETLVTGNQAQEAGGIYLDNASATLVGVDVLNNSPDDLATRRVAAP